MDIRFTLERLLLRGRHYRLPFAALIIAFVSLIAGTLVLLLDPKFDDAGAAVWWSFLRLSDPGYLGDDEGAVSVTISTIVTVLGYVLFLGLLVAILTQWLNGFIGRRATRWLPFRACTVPDDVRCSAAECRCL